VAEVPGSYGRVFEDDTIDAVAAALAQRMRTAEALPPRQIPKLAQQAEFFADDIPVRMIPGERRTITVQIRNASTVTWPAGETSGLMLGNRWLDEAGAVIEWIDGRVPLPELAPDAQVRLSLPITAPRLQGNVQLIVDVVEEGVTWFDPTLTSCLRAQVIIGEQGCEASP
jgi:hypothetical protein